ncbi:MAG: hypothetical protein ACREIU_00955, partial [Planctomycetota bacterium]
MPNAWAIEVFHRDDLPDPEGDAALAAVRESGLPGVTSVRSIRGYLLPASVPRAAVERAISDLLADPIGDRAALHSPGALPVSRGVRITVRRHPGVMDPVAASVRRGLALLGVEAERAAT